jgi:hypothetical protein
MKFNSHPVAFTQGTHFASGGNAMLVHRALREQCSTLLAP